MKLFLDRHKTLLPRVDVVFLLTRFITSLGIAWHTFFNEASPEDLLALEIILATYLVHAGVFYAAMRGRFDLKLAYLSTILYDVLFVPVFIIYTGGLDSSFYLLYFMTISASVYILRFWHAVGALSIISVSYTFFVYTDLNLDNGIDFFLRLGFLWVFFLAISYASDFLRKSERRLLKLFDTLNLRTSELEKSQAQLEMIYENTRALASILDVDGVVKEVMRIMGNTLRYDHYAVIFLDKWRNYYYRARSISGKQTFLLKAISNKHATLINKVAELHEPIRIKDIAERGDYSPLYKVARSAMIVPMITHGQTNGILIVESSDIDYFVERDVQLLTLVARSTALALENAELHKRTEELTVIDALTETYNYRYFIQKLEEEKKRALRYDLPLSIIMVDIDWFKKLNDTYGHEAGNTVLRTLSGVIKKCIRDVDIFARYGGEEFVIILPQTTNREASPLGERIRERVENTVIDVGKAGKVKVTVSVGVSSFPENGRSHEELVSAADQALYRAKGSGKNLVRVI
jgi:diguanylate cyclase (GGDEF)-like protein